MAEDTFISGEEHVKHSTKQSRQVSATSHQLILAIVALALIGLGFLGGVTYQRHHGEVSVSSNMRMNGPGGFAGRRMGTIGQVTAVNSTSISITNQRTNAAETYSITSSTAITDNGQTVTASDIQTGDTVLISVTGSGSTTAARILVNPSFGGFGGEPAPDSTSGSATPTTN